MKNQKLILSLCLIGCFFSSKSFGQTPPQNTQAGVVEKNIVPKDSEPSRFKETLPFVEQETLPPQINLSQGVTIAVKDFSFEGNTLFASADLMKILEPYKGDAISVMQLKQACQKITAQYKDKGFFLARAYLPEQQITQGIVRIVIVEGKLGTVRVEGALHYSSEFIKNHFFVGPGDVVNYHALLKSLFLLNEYRDLNVKAQFLKGTAPYTVDVVLNVEDLLPLHGLLDYNNFGSKYVSNHRAGAMAEYTNFLLQGGKFSVRGVSGFPADHLFFGKTAYSFPVNRYGTKAEVSYLHSDFNVQKEYRELDAGGYSEIYGLNVVHPLIRNRKTSLDLNGGFDYKTIRNYLLGDISSKDDLRVFKIGMDYSHKDQLKGRNYFSVLSSYGAPDILDGSSHDNALSSRAGAGGEFIKCNFDFARFQSIKQDVYLVLRSSLQVASDVLPVSEQFSIGGPDSVRGFSQSEYLGDSGHSLSLELRFSPPFISEKRIPFVDKPVKDHIQLVAFMDYGKVYLRNPMADEGKGYELSGAGVGARIKLTDDYSVRVDAGYPVSGNDDDSAPMIYIQSINKF